MLRQVTDRIRLLGNDLLSSSQGDHWKPVRVLRQALGTANDLAGRPFCTREELERREVRRSGPPAAVVTARPATRREPAPVMVYFDGKDHRTRAKLEELLRSRDIPFRVLDVTDDESTRSWAQTAAQREEFPLLFIAGEPVGGLHEVTQLDVNGGLRKRVFG